jgi:hypothetical protein
LITDIYISYVRIGAGIIVYHHLKRKHVFCKERPKTHIREMVRDKNAFFLQFNKKLVLKRDLNK